MTTTADQEQARDLCPLCTLARDGSHDGACAARSARPRPGSGAGPRNGGAPEPRTVPDADADALATAYREALERGRATGVLL